MVQSDQGVGAFGRTAEWKRKEPLPLWEANAESRPSTIRRRIEEQQDRVSLRARERRIRDYVAPVIEVPMKHWSLPRRRRWRLAMSRYLVRRDRPRILALALRYAPSP